MYRKAFSQFSSVVSKSFLAHGKLTASKALPTTINAHFSNFKVSQIKEIQNLKNEIDEIKALPDYLTNPVRMEATTAIRHQISAMLQGLLKFKSYFSCNYYYLFR